MEERSVNGKKKLEGSLEDVRFWANLLVDVWQAQAKVKETNPESRLHTLTYDIPIYGNPKAGKSVKLTVREDERVDKGCIQIDSGGELLAWQSKVKTICDHCKYREKIGETYLCEKWSHPSATKKFCGSYSYKP